MVPYPYLKTCFRSHITAESSQFHRFSLRKLPMRSRKSTICLWRRVVIYLLLIASPLTFAYTPYSNHELEQLEKEFVQQINHSNQVIRHPLATQYINHLGQVLAHNSQYDLPSFFIVRSNEINAFAGPGGHIGINSALILATENESELGAVMSHEIAHVRLNHLYHFIEHNKHMRIPMLAGMLASMALGIINPALASGAMMATMGGFAQDNINFIRSNEKEADRIGIDMLIKSGLDPKGMSGFFKKMQDYTRFYYTANVPAILRTHPLDAERIAEAENRCLHLPRKYYKSSMDYLLFKELIRNESTSDRRSLLDYYEHYCQKDMDPMVCQYGHALTLLDLNKAKQAKSLISSLLKQYPDNFYFIIAMAHAEIGLSQFPCAISRLEQLKENHPENYAATVEHAKALIAANRVKDAAYALLLASREFKEDLPVCELLAQAEAANHRKAYAYFTKGQCYMLQGQRKEALRHLKYAKTLSKDDHLLQARIDDKIDTIKSAEPS